MRIARRIVIAAWVACMPLRAMAATVQRLDADVTLPVRIDESRYDLAARIYRPAGPGPFPLVVINHGTPADKARLRTAQIGFSRAAGWFVEHGFMVVLAQRPGFGQSGGDYLEAAGNCRNEDYVVAGRRTATIEAAIVTAAARLAQADPDRIVVVGQSAGGLGAVALGDRPPPGVLGIISFAGGRGGNGKEHVCAGEGRLVAAAHRFGEDNRLPQLWLYAANDHFFRPELAHRMARAFAQASSPPLSFVDLPPFGSDGHQTFGRADPAVWALTVETFLHHIAHPQG